MLRELKRELHLRGIILQADKDVKHGIVVQVMDIAKRSGIGSVFISARFVNHEY